MEFRDGPLLNYATGERSATCRKVSATASLWSLLLAVAAFPSALPIVRCRKPPDGVGGGVSGGVIYISVKLNRSESAFQEGFLLYVQGKPGSVHRRPLPVLDPDAEALPVSPKGALPGDTPQSALGGYSLNPRREASACLAHGRSR